MVVAPVAKTVEEMNDAIVVNQIVQDAILEGTVESMLSNDFVESSTVGVTAAR